MQEKVNVDAIRRLAALIKTSSSTVFFGGAGVSTESGVPDFRSASGIYAQEKGAEEILSGAFMQREPEAFYRFYRKYFMPEGILPNACHRALAELEGRGLLQALVTQNVDGLHQRAGSRKVIELHGSGERFYCTACGRSYSLNEIQAMPLVPHCSCGALLRPDIVLYGENLDTEVLNAAVRAIEGAALLIIGGSSLTVYPAAGLLRFQPRAGKKVLIDLSAAADDPIELMIRGRLGEVFTALMQELSFWPST